MSSPTPVGRRRHESGVAGARTPDPVLRTSKFSRLGRTAAPLPHQHFVCFANESNRDGQAIRKTPQTVMHRADVVGDLLHIGIDGGTRRVTTLVDQQVRQQRLRTFDLRRQQGFLADIHVKEEIGVGQHPKDPLKMANGSVRLVEQPVELVDAECGDGRQSWRNERLHRLANGRHDHPLPKSAVEICGGWCGHLDRN